MNLPQPFEPAAESSPAVSSAPAPAEPEAPRSPTTGTPASGCPLRREDQDGIDALRDVLRRTGYEGRAVYEALGVETGRQPARPDLPLYLYRIRARKPLHTLIRLLYLGTSVSEEEATEAFFPLGWQRFRDLGLIESGSEGIRATCAISAHGHLWIVHDRLDPETLARLPDYVLGMNPPARLLAGLTPRRAVGSTLDLGTGSGLQAFLAAAHSRRVVATDISPRALDFARFNARLNGIINVEFREGSLFEPVAGDRFDLIVTNPPFVISPDQTLVFRDSGMGGEPVCARIVRAAGNHLADGGRLLMLANWANPAADPKEPWDAPVRSWLAGSPCDAWILRHDTASPLSYATDWNRDLDAAKYGAALERWMSYYEREGIRGITQGLLILRRPSGRPPVVLSEEAPRCSSEGIGDQVDRLLSNLDFLAAHPGEADVLGQVFRPAPDHEVVRTLASKGTGYGAGRVQLRQLGGFRFEGTLDDLTLRLLTLLDGRRTVREAVAALAEEGKLEATAITPPAARLVRRMVTLGFLVPAAGPTDRPGSSPGGGT